MTERVRPTRTFSDAQMRRYSRQILLPSVGGRGQTALLAAEIAVDVDGVGGRIAALLLAAAGVGRLVLDGALDRRLAAADIRFPLTADDRGYTLGEAMASLLTARNPDTTVVLARIRPPTCLRIDDDGPSLPLATAFARAGAAASALTHALATRAP